MPDPTASFSNFEGVLGGTPADSFTTVTGTPFVLHENAGVAMDTVTALPSAVAVANKKAIALTKDTADPWSTSDVLYWDSVNSAVTRRPTQYPIGFAAAPQTASATTGDVWLMMQRCGMFYQAYAASSSLTSWTSFTAFSNGTTPAIPANYLVTGSTIRIRGRVTWVAVNSTNTLQLEVKFISTAILLNVARNATAADVVTFEAEIVIRTSGSSGTWVSSGMSFDGAIGGVPAANVYAVASTAIDTTNAANNKIIVGAVCSVSNAGNQALLDELTVEFVR